MTVITNRAGYNGMTQRIDDSVFPRQIRDMIREKVDLEDAVLPEGIGMLEDLASQDTDQLRLIPSWSTFIADTLNQFNMAPNSRVAEVYWSISRSSVRGILSRVRTALAELIAELIALTPEGQEVPDKDAADQAVQIVFTGERPAVSLTVQHAGGGTNVVAAAGPVAVAGADGTAIGGQTASGANSRVAGTQTASGAGSSVTGGQSVQAAGDAVTAGQAAAVPAAGEQPVKEGWWARLRKRGAVVAFATIVGALAGVAGVVIAIMLAAGWKP